MAKKKKGKVINLYQSPEKFIKTRARQLPIYECLITEIWEDTGMANIIIARRHSNDNLTFGIYLVDLLCLGVKDSFYGFNIPEQEYRELIEKYFPEDIEIVKCDYVLAHNIIYGAIEFAEEYGFHPHKDFEVSKYILEKDDENIELIDIEFGEDGIPCVVTTINNEPKKVIAQLEKTAGHGNYKIIYLDDEDFEDEYDSGDFENWTDEDWEEFERGEKEVSQKSMFKFVDYIYEHKFGEEEDLLNDVDPDNLISQEYKISYGPIKEIDYFTSEKEKEKSMELYFMSSSERVKEAIPLLKDMMKKYPKNPVYYTYLANAYNDIGNTAASDEVVLAVYNKFPDYLFAKCNYALHLHRDNRVDEIPAVFDNNYELKSLYPNRKEFHIDEAISFFSVMCLYFSEKNNIKRAEIYYKLLNEFDDKTNPIKELAIQSLQEQKIIKLFGEDFLEKILNKPE